MNPELEQKLAHSLTAEDTGLVPFLPYLLQDLWELGGSGKTTVALLKKYLAAGAEVLDLACGKGAVSIRIAKETGWRVKGVDLLPEFVAEAAAKAEGQGVAALCTFRQGDANKAVETERNWDVVVFSASGNVLGTPEETLQKLSGVVRPGGYILLDESYLKDGADSTLFEHDYRPYTEWAALFHRFGLEELEQVDTTEEEEDHNDSDLAAIAARVEELAAQYPEKAAMFRQYLQSQQNEVDDIENKLVNVVWLLRKKA